VALVMNAMHGVTQEGTSTRVFAGAPYKTGGKTGTAQAVGVKANEKYNAARLSEFQRDHSLYTAFAPLDVPTIALAVIVENAGFGAAAAAPIARRVFDYVLAGQWPSEEDIAATREGRSVAPMGTPRRADEVPMPELGLPLLAGSLPPAVQTTALAPPAAAPCRPGAGHWPADRRGRPPGLADASSRWSAGSTGPLLAGGAGARPGHGHHVLGRLRPRHPLRRPWPQHAAGAGR
jgi:penicillin-binding protein 2